MTTLTDTQVITASGGLVELGYSQITAAVSVTGSDISVIGDLTVVCDGSPVAIEFYSPRLDLAGTTLGDGCEIYLWVDGVKTGRIAERYHPNAATGPYTTAYGVRRLTPSAGSHTFKITATRQGATSPSISAGAGTTTTQSPAFLRVSKIVQATQWPAVTTGTIICTSSTRPAAPFEGQQIYETDTGIRLTYRSATWVGENEVVDLVPTTGLAVSATITPAQMFGSGGKRGMTTLGISNTTPTAAACYAHLGSVVNRSAEFYFLTPSSGSNILAGTGVTFRYNGGFTTNFSYNSDSAYKCVYVCNSATTGSILIN